MERWKLRNSGNDFPDAKKKALIVNGTHTSKKINNHSVVQGRNLVSKDFNGFSDPYVIISIKEQIFKSKIIKKTLNPQWEEEFFLYVLMLLTLTYN